MTKRIHYCYLLTRALPEGGCRYYVGIRTAPKGKTPKTDTSYMGSGPAIVAAVEDERAAFTKTILDVFDTRAEARAMERALVGLPTANRPWSYNRMTGGGSGLHSEETKARLRQVSSARFKDPAALERCREARRRPAAVEKHRASLRRSLAGLSDDERRAMTAKPREASRTPDARKKNSDAKRREWAAMTDEQRRARTAKGTEASRTQAQRRRRGVQMVLAALIVNKYGGAEAA